MEADNWIEADQRTLLYITMVLYLESDEGHTSEETWAADRPPQLNSTVCSCQSGSGCNHELSGGSGRVVDVHGDDGASITSLDTLVASNNSEADESSPPSPDGPEQHQQQQQQQQLVDETDAFELEAQLVSLWETTTASFEEIRARFGGSFNNRRERMRRTERALGLVGDHDDDMPDSLMNEPLESGDHSVVVSDKGSVRCISPGPGVGAWTTDGLKLGIGMRKYYFVVSPLRLTPQRRNCRGLLAQHLVVGDSASSSDVSNYFFRE